MTARLALLLTLTVGLVGCDDGGPQSDAGAHDAGLPDSGPPLRDDGWENATPESMGMDPAVLGGVRDYAFAEGRHTQGVVVVRRGVIVAEWYAAGVTRDAPAASWSVGKSFTSALVGIAIEEGLISSVDVSMSDYIPEWVGTPYAAITLESVLHMATGLTWDESYSAGDRMSSDVATLVLTEESPLDHVIARPIEADPGARFLYSSGNTLLLSRVLEVATGMPVHEYAQSRLFAPLGIEGAEWWRARTGETLTYCCLDMRSRDFARFGQLFLDRGAYEGTQIVAEAWIDASLVPSPAFDGYGYQWWLDGRRYPGIPDDVFAGHGFDGQHIFVIPSLELVVVRNGRYYRSRGEPVADPSLFARYPSGGLISNRGTIPPDTWDDVAFLRPILDSVID